MYLIAQTNPFTWKDDIHVVKELRDCNDNYRTKYAMPPFYDADNARIDNLPTEYVKHGFSRLPISFNDEAIGAICNHITSAFTSGFGWESVIPAGTPFYLSPDMTEIYAQTLKIEKKGIHDPSYDPTFLDFCKSIAEPSAEEEDMLFDDWCPSFFKRIYGIQARRILDGLPPLYGAKIQGEKGRIVKSFEWILLHRDLLRGQHICGTVCV